MLDLEGFRNRFPEFSACGDTLLQTALDDASARVSPGVFGDTIDRAHGLKTAHMLCCSPWGTGARLNPKVSDGKTIYSKALQELITERGGLRGNG